MTGPRCTDRPPAAAAARRAPRLPALAALFLALAAGGCSGGDSANGCSDVAEKICSRLDSCSSLDTVFASNSQCVDSFVGLFKVDGSDDAACEATWSTVKQLNCADFEAYFKI